MFWYTCPLPNMKYPSLTFQLPAVQSYTVPSWPPLGAVHEPPPVDPPVEPPGLVVVEACGGPLYYSERHTRLMAGAGLPWPLRADYWGWAEPLSVHLLAPQARHPGLTRYPYDTVRSRFAATPPRGLPAPHLWSHGS